MTPELYAALLSLLLAAIGVLGLFVRYIGIKLQAAIIAAKKAADEAQRTAAASAVALAENTEITRSVEANTNGALQKARNEATKWRAMAERQARVLAEQKWLISQLQKREDGRALIDRVMQARRAVVHDGDYASLEQRLLRESREGSQ